MKKLMNVALLLILVMGASAQNQYSYYNDDDHNSNRYNNNRGSLVLNTSSITREYVVNINNRLSYLLNGNNNLTTLNNLGSGNHYVEVYRIKNNVFGQQRRDLLYSGNIQLKSGFETTVTIDMFDRVNVNDRQVYFNNGNGNNGGWQNGGNGCGHHRGNGWGHKKDRRKKCQNRVERYDW